MHGFEQRKQGHIEIDVQPVDADIVLRYQDNGCGMEPETRERMFEPFFTTKRGRGGIGLGMHIVYNLVTQVLSGKISCDSEVGSGVDITVTIPKQTASERD